MSERTAAVFGMLLLCAASLGGCGDDGGVEPPPLPPGGAGGAGTGGSGGAEPTGFVGSVGDITYVGPWGGAVTALAEDPSHPARTYAIAGGQVFRSDDGGVAWQATAPVDTEALGLLVLPDGRVLAGTLVDIVTSSDGGDSWQSIKHNVEAGYGFGIQARALAYEAGPPARIWAALGSYQTAPVWSVVDGQTNWQPWNAPTGWATDPLNGAAQFTSIDVVPHAGSGETFVFASYELAFSGGGGVFCSTDSAASFANCSTGLPAAPFYRVHIYDDVVTLAGGHVFGSAYAGVYFSADQGASWTAATSSWSEPVANDVVRLGNGDFVAASYGQGLLRSADLTAAWAPLGDLDGMEIGAVVELASGELLCGPEQLGTYRSTDGGSSWTASATGMNRIEVEDAAVDPATPSQLLAALSSLNSGLTMATSDGIDGWGPIPSLPHPRFSYVSIAPSDRWYVVSDGPVGQANDGVYVSVDHGGAFAFIGPLDGALMDHDIIGVVDLGSGQQLVTAGQYWADGDWSPFVMSSSDGGQSWTERFRGEPDHAPWRLAATAAGELLVAIQGESIVHLDATFQATPLTIDGVNEGMVYDVATCYRDGSTLLAVGSTDATGFATGAFISRDGGGSWSSVDFGAGANESPFYVAVHPHDCEFILLTTSEGRVLASGDSGGSWTEVDLGVELGIRDVKLVPTNDDYEAVLLVFGSGGVVAIHLETAVSYE